MNLTAISPLIVLLAEDDDNDVLLTRRAFRRIPQRSELMVVNTGERVVEYLRAAAAGVKGNPVPDALVLDHRMGHVSGVDVLFWLRTEMRWRTLPVLLLSNALAPCELEIIAGLRAAYAIKTSHISDLPEALLQGIRSAMALVHTPLPPRAPALAPQYGRAAVAHTFSAS